jgi:cobaltochelatase CobS
MTTTKKDFGIGETFGIKGVNPKATVSGYTIPNEYVPTLDPIYVFSKSVLSNVLMWINIGRGDGLYLSGPTGSGKTSLINQIAARLNIPVQSVTGHSRLESPELIGRHVIRNGSMEFEYGPLAKAAKYGHWFVMNEGDLVDPSTQAGLNEIAAGSPLTIPENGGEVIKPHAGFRFIITGNSNGGGDATGLYQGVLRQNLAFMDRFWHVEMDYPEEDVELGILEKVVPHMDLDIRKKVLQVAQEVREIFMGNSDKGSAIEVTFSTRTLIRWARIMFLTSNRAKAGVNVVEESLNLALANRAMPSSKEALHQIAQRIFGDPKVRKQGAADAS